SIKTCVGTDDFMCADFATRGSPSALSGDLVLERTLEGFTEVGSLYLRADHRVSGAGRFLARARYILMSNQEQLLRRPIVDQLRGHSDEAGYSAYYDKIWSKRLRLTYQQSDARLAREGAAFIHEAFEGLKMKRRSLSLAAADAIGRP